MRINIAVKYALLLFILSGLTLLNAQTAESKHSVLVGANYWLSTGARDDLKNSLGFEALYQYKFNKNLSATGGLFYFAPSIKGNAIPNGSLKLMPVIANAQYTFNAAKYVPYISGGLALFIVKYSLSSDTIKAYDDLGFTISTKGKSKAGFNVGGGTYLVMNKKYSIFADIRFFLCKTSLDNTIVDKITNISHEQSTNISLNSILLSGGIKFNL